VARNRQRAKQRQAARREARLAQGGAAPGRQEDASDGARRDDADTGDGAALAAPPADDPVEAADLAVGAPPEELGRSDTALEEGEDEPAEVAVAEPEVPAEPGGAVRPDRAERPRAPERGRVMAFLVAVVAELRRVEWPNRQALFTLTAVVLGFVLLAGGYLGLLDAIFSRVIESFL
jgi:preprotein translocase SecE subunit